MGIRPPPVLAKHSGEGVATQSCRETKCVRRDPGLSPAGDIS